MCVLLRFSNQTHDTHIAAVAAIRTLGFTLQLSVSLRRTAEAFIDLIIKKIAVCKLLCFDYGFLFLIMANYCDCIMTYPLHAKGTNIKNMT